MQTPASNRTTEESLSNLLVQLEKMDDLPSPPDIVTRIIELLRDPESDIKELMDELTKDPALVAKILKTANSAMYARRREVTNLAQALLTLGQAAAMTLALSFSLVNTLRKNKGGGIDLVHYWKRSLLTAIGAREIGVAIGAENIEELFLAGLLQDIGLQVLDKLMPEQYQSFENPKIHAALAKQEAEVLGVDHAWIGAWLLEKWSLPEIICAAVRFSHDASAADVAPEVQRFVDCVSVASRLSDILLTDPGESGIAAFSVMMQDRMGLDEQATFGVLSKVEQRIPDVESQFGMDIMDVEIAADILDRARKLLTDVSLSARREISALQQEIDSLGNRAQSLEQANHTDKLTGLKNRDFMEKHLAEWVSRARKLEFPLSLAFMDLDGFKAVNDTYSHSAGDEILRSTARLLSRQIRENDALSRFGGDEFVLLLGGESSENALVVCNRILNAFNTTRHEVDGNQVELHISIGLATFDGSREFTGQQLLQAADEALKYAKQHGKAQVVLYSDIA
ncbi:MAG: HDOD domain-containing protein [Pseudomonadales bacterium]